MANRYWVGGTDDWNATADSKWALTSGGAGGQAVPTDADDVFFDANSGAGTITITATANTLGLNFTGFTGTLAGGSTIIVLGSLTAVAGMTWSHTGGIIMRSAGSVTITSAGKTFSQLTLNTGGGTYTLQDALSLTNALSLTVGTFDANNQTVTIGNFISSNSNVRTITMGSGLWTFTRSANPWFTATTTNLTFNKDTANIKLTLDTTTIDRTFNGGGLTFNDLWNATTGTGAIIIAGSNTFNDLKNDAGREMQFTDGTTTTVTTFTAIGTSGNEITLSGTADAGWTISDSAGTNTVDYCIISYSTAQGGATWEATNSTDDGNNTGWTITGAVTFIPLILSS